MPTPGDPTKMTLSTEDTRAFPVSANLPSITPIKFMKPYKEQDMLHARWQRVNTLLLHEPNFPGLLQQQEQLE